LVLPFAPEGIKVLVKLRLIFAVHHNPLLHHRRLEKEGQQFKDANIITAVPEVRYELPLEGRPVGCLGSHNAQINVASWPGFTSGLRAVEKHP
jgi:hypothetical protein